MLGKLKCDSRFPSLTTDIPQISAFESFIILFLTEIIAVFEFYVNRLILTSEWLKFYYIASTDSATDLISASNQQTEKKQTMTKLTCKIAIPTPIPPMTAIFPLTKSCSALEQP